MDQHFAVCACGMQWRSREEFLSDPDIELLSYVSSNMEHQLGRFQFLHTHEGCDTTLSLNAGLFSDLYVGPDISTEEHDFARVPGYCLYHSSIGPGRIVNEYQFVCQLIELFCSWPKAASISDTPIAARH